MDIAFAKAKTLQLTDLNLPNNALVLVAQSIEKPGNLGALLRTADAAAVDAVLLADPKCDLYNPNVIRSSVGCALTVPIASTSTSEICEFLRMKEIDLYAATLQTSIPYHTASFKNSSAIAVGTEATGLTDEMR
ncbi:rRNA methyltransferase, partial [Pseudomonas fluorescens]